MQQLNGFSIIVCCYNSESRIEATLSYLLKLVQTPGFSYEIIIVDNASTDWTTSVAQQAYQNSLSKIPFRIVSETRQGLNYARERGLDEAVYRYIIFCDDDNWLQEDYLVEAYAIIHTHDDVGILGGQGIAVPEVSPPEWFELVKSAYAVGKKSDPEGYLTKRESFIAGAGMVLRREAWLKLKQASYKSHLSDRKGKELSSAGDIELSYAMKMAGYKLFYSEKLVFSHFIPGERLQWSYILKGCIGYGKAVSVIESYLYVMKDDIQDEKDIKYFFNAGVLKNISIDFLRIAMKYLFNRNSRQYQIEYYITRSQLKTTIDWLLRGQTILQELISFKKGVHLK